MNIINWKLINELINCTPTSWNESNGGTILPQLLPTRWIVCARRYFRYESSFSLRSCLRLCGYNCPVEWRTWEQPNGNTIKSNIIIVSESAMIKSIFVHKKRKEFTWSYTMDMIANTWWSAIVECARFVFHKFFKTISS